MTLYDVLGVDITAGEDEIAEAYTLLAEKYHPDKYQGNPQVGRQCLQEVNEAYALLSDAQKRKAYDEALSPKKKLTKSRATEIFLAMILLTIAAICAAYILDALEIINIL